MPQLGILFDKLSTSNYFLQIAFIFGVQNLQSIDFSKIYWFLHWLQKFMGFVYFSPMCHIWYWFLSPFFEIYSTSSRYIYYTYSSSLVDMSSRLVSTTRLKNHFFWHRVWSIAKNHTLSDEKWSPRPSPLWRWLLWRRRPRRRGQKPPFRQLAVRNTI